MDGWTQVPLPLFTIHPSAEILDFVILVDDKMVDLPLSLRCSWGSWVYYNVGHTEESKW